MKQHEIMRGKKLYRITSSSVFASGQAVALEQELVLLVHG
jgi:hypothetical protein